MQLRINTSIKRSVITVELETVNFCTVENQMLDQFGEPVLHFEKCYFGEFAVSIHKKIRTNFKVKVRFDGTKDIDKASTAVNQFIDEIKEALPLLMEEFMDKTEMIDLKAGTETVDISCHTTTSIPNNWNPRYPHIGTTHVH